MATTRKNTRPISEATTIAPHSFLSGHRKVFLGRIDNTSLIGNIHHAQGTLKSIVDEGWFVAERTVVFDFVSHFTSVDDWLRDRDERRSTSVVDPAIIDQARGLLVAQSPGDLIVSEGVLATRLVRGQPVALSTIVDRVS